MQREEASTTEEATSSSTPVGPLAVPSDPASLKVSGGIGFSGIWAQPYPEGSLAALGECTVAKEPFYDVDQGVQVVIKGASSNVVGATELGPSEWEEETGMCTWWFSATVPRGEGFYSAEITGVGSSDVMAEEDFGKGGGLYITNLNTDKG